MRDMTYTQFWNLVRERKVDTVSAPAAAARLPAAARPGRNEAARMLGAGRGGRDVIAAAGQRLARWR